MTKSDWARREIEIFSREQDGYGCMCAESALKAFLSLCVDGHSGFSFGVTKGLLERLMGGLPLKPIEDKDFFDQNGMVQEDPRYLKEMELKSNLQCKRMLGLFRKEHLNGIVDYTDTNRVRGIDLEHPDIDFYSNEATEWVDRLFPITMPYFPMNEVRYKVFFKDNEPKYIITPNNKRVDIYK